MAWPTQGLFGIKGLGADRTTRHTVLVLLLIANAITLVYAFDRIVEKSGFAYQTVTPDFAFFGLLALSALISVVSWFLPQYQDKSTRVGARAVISGLPIGGVLILLNAVL